MRKLLPHNPPQGGFFCVDMTANPAIYSVFMEKSIQDLVKGATMKNQKESSTAELAAQYPMVNMKETMEIMQRASIVKRNGALVPFRKERILLALEAAFKDTHRLPKANPLPSDLAKIAEEVCDRVLVELHNHVLDNVALTVEGIQDQVEIALMKMGHHAVARDYIIYRDQHKALREDSPQNLKIVRQDGAMVRFNPIKIATKLEVAFRKTHDLRGPIADSVVEAINALTQQIVARAVERAQNDETLTSASIDDEMEQTLMREGYFAVAKTAILERASLPLSAEKTPFKEQEDKKARAFNVTAETGETRVLAERELVKRLKFACRGLGECVSHQELLESVIAQFYEGMKESEVDLALILATRTKIEREPAYAKVGARLLLDGLYRETLQCSASDPSLESKHRRAFKAAVERGVALKHYHPELLNFDLGALANAMELQRDDRFSYLGLQILYDRYFIHHEGKRLETPQMFWMRVAMGLALGEKENKEARAIEFYNTLSQFLFVSSTPTLFNAGTLHSQLSSCYLSTVLDELGHIFKVVSDDAQLSKWAGGIGNDWTNVRATGALIQGTNGKSQGVIPFLKVANDTAVAVNQGGKRKGAMCAYLETWHLDIEDFLELRKNTGDERRRTHDMNTANWIPDLFIKRVRENGHWTLFSPSDVPDLHHLYGKAFETRYLEYERRAVEGEIKLFKRVEALQLWRKMLSMLFETGHPWITFKDPSNVRSPQDHCGVVHSSNLCTEILLNTSKDETAVCNLGSINLAEHMLGGALDKEKLAQTVRTAVRMLDNVIDINFYPTAEAKASNLQHRPIGLGLMGFQDVLYMQDISYASHEAIAFADKSMELIAYYAILASSELAKERGTYPSYLGSKWERGLLPIDTLDLLEREREGNLDVDRSSTLDWAPVRAHIKEWGMRNCNTMAIAPTATIANVVGVTQSIEPTYKHLFVKSNLSGEFTVPNPYLVDRLKKLNLWDEEMLDDLKYFDGSIAEIERIPEEIKRIFLTAFEIDPDWLIECASRRQKWIDMGQSLNLYLSQPSGKKLHQTYIFAWTKGLKTTYYLRTLGATQIEKATTDVNKRGIQPRWMKNKSASSDIVVERGAPKKACTLDEGCESCQ